MPAAGLFPNLPAALAQPVAGTAPGGALPLLILRTVEVVSHHGGVPAQAIVARKGGPEVHAVHRKALFLASSLTYDIKAFAATCRQLGVPHPWIGLGILRKASSEIGEAPNGVEIILELAGKVHKDAPAMLLGEIPAYDLEAA